MLHILEPSEDQSSLISYIEYDDKSLLLKIGFRKYYIDFLTYVNFPENYFNELCVTKSLGRFYLQLIKPNFKIKKENNMADKIIKCKINVTDINKEWLFQGEKGVYLNFTVLFNEEQDDYGNNGMIVQDVPTKIYKKEIEEKVPVKERQRGVILGNSRVFANANNTSEESKPGVEYGKMLDKESDVLDDIPF